ncbi:hypothetical protein TGDOM2_398350, partial [Toxoplasma gondii GAB2-2007-GAL-DOM2]
ASCISFASSCVSRRYGAAERDERGADEEAEGGATKSHAAARSRSLRDADSCSSYSTGARPEGAASEDAAE